MSRSAASDLLETLRIGTATDPGRSFTIGVVQAATSSSTVSACTILFDGETVVGVKAYPCLSSYAPKVGDRVVLAPVGSRTSWIVLGAIGPSSGDVRVAGSGGFVAQSPNGTFWRLTPSDSGASVWTAI